MQGSVDRSTCRRALATLAAGLLCCVVGAQAGEAMELGVADNPVFLSQSYYSREQALSKAAAFGARTLRLEVYWSDYVRWGYAPYDAAVDAARARGITTQLTLVGTPKYDNGDQRIRWRNPNVRLFTGWMGAVVNHFRGRVTRYSVWNEPNQCYFLSQGNCSYSRAAIRARVNIYRTLYRAGYRAAKQADRRAQVLIGELSPINDPLGFLRSVANGSYRLLAYGAALHPYELVKHRSVTGISRTPLVKRTVSALARAGRLRTPRGATVPIYYTEFGYITGYGGLRSESQRASRTVAALRYAKRQGIRQLVYYHLVKAPSGLADPFPSGIVTSTGGDTSTYTALVRAGASL